MDLSYNALYQTQDVNGTFTSLFRRNADLLSIDLSSNGLSYLHGETFRANTNLTEIHLSYNNFKQLYLQISSQPQLRIMDLRYNKIQYLDYQSRQNVELLYSNVPVNQQLEQRNTTLQVLLEGNHFTCSFEAKDFLQWFVASPIFNESYLCHVNGEEIQINEAAVEVAEYDCGREQRRRRTILLSTLIPGFCLAAIVTAAIIKIISYKRHKRRLEHQRHEDRLRLIQENDIGFPFTLFLSYCSLVLSLLSSTFFHHFRLAYLDFFNPNMASGLVHPEHLDECISNFWGAWCLF